METILHKLPTVEELQEQLNNKTINEIIEILGSPDDVHDFGNNNKGFYYKNEKIYEPYSKTNKGIKVKILNGRFSNIRHN